MINSLLYLPWSIPRCRWLVTSLSVILVTMIMVDTFPSSSSRGIVSVSALITTTGKRTRKVTSCDSGGWGLVHRCSCLSSMSDDDSESAASPLLLSTADKQRFTAMKSRHQTIPIMITVETLVPGQTLSLQSPEPKLRKLLEFVRKGEDNEIGIIGIHPQTGKPMSVGVTLAVNEENTRYDAHTATFHLYGRGHRQFEVQDLPFMDESGSFFLAPVEMVDARPEKDLAPQELRETLDLSNRLDDLVEKWVRLVIILTRKTDRTDMTTRLQDLGPMPPPLPSHLTERALWVAALFNPIPALDDNIQCLDIRPAMLSCKNDHHRMLLAHTALRSSIDNLSEMKRSF